MIKAPDTPLLKYADPSLIVTRVLLPNCPCRIVFLFLCVLLCFCDFVLLCVLLCVLCRDKRLPDADAG